MAAVMKVGLDCGWFVLLVHYEHHSILNGCYYVQQLHVQINMSLDVWLEHLRFTKTLSLETARANIGSAVSLNVYCILGSCQGCWILQGQRPLSVEDTTWAA